MRRSVLKMIEEFRLYWKHYVLQSLFATVAVFVVLCFLSLQNAVIIASIGASTFIVFAMPDSITAKPRNVIGGHLVGLFWGFVFSLVPHAAVIGSLVWLFAGGGSFHLHHGGHGHGASPRFGHRSWSRHYGHVTSDVLITVVLSIILLSLIHRFFKPYLRDLT